LYPNDHQRHIPVFTFVKGSTEKKKPNQPMILERTQRVK